MRLKTVQTAYAHGIAVMPLVAREKKPAKAGWQNEPMPTPEEIEVWARQGNIGFRAGAISGGLFVIDVDPGADISELGELPKTVTVLTGRTDPDTGKRGQHLYFRSKVKLLNSAGKLGEHIDTRGDGGFVVGPGSIHPKTGAIYEFAPGLGLGEVEIAEFPQHLVDRLMPKLTVATTPKRSVTAANWLEQVPLELKVEAG